MQPDDSTEDFGIPLAPKDNDAQMGKLSEGEQNGQENLEEVEEAGSNQAVDQSCRKGRTSLGIRPSLTVRSAPMDSTRPEKSTENDKQGRYLSGSGPV